jgi:type VI secretion system protein ImpM
MSAMDTPLQVSYFGKLPSRGDFVKTPGNHALTSMLDNWVAQGIELLAQDPGWKLTYDAAPSCHFAFLSSQRKQVTAGHLMPSRDLSERRFPFLSAAQFAVLHPLDFIARSPLALARLWARLDRQSQHAFRAEDDSAAALRAFLEEPISVNAALGTYDTPYRDFLEMQTVGMLQTALQQAGHQVNVRRLLLAMGVLLQPLLSSGGSDLDKGLSLPLPADPLYKPMVATLWLDLIAGFLGRVDYELSIFINNAQAPRLIIGFNGSSGRTLHSVLDPLVSQESNINIDDADWVDDHIEDEYSFKKLSTYLDQGQLSLRLACATFRETFLGT